MAPQPSLAQTPIAQRLPPPAFLLVISRGFGLLERITFTCGSDPSPSYRAGALQGVERSSVLFPFRDNILNANVVDSLFHPPPVACLLPCVILPNVDVYAGGARAFYSTTCTMLPPLPHGVQQHRYHLLPLATLLPMPAPLCRTALNAGFELLTYHGFCIWLTPRSV